MGSKHIVMDIGGSKILGAVMDEQNNILCRVKKKTRPELGIEAVDGRIADTIGELLEKCKLRKEDISAIGAGAPGVVDTATGTILFSPNIPWRNHPLGANMEKAMGMPFLVGNDVNVGVLGEWKFGAAKGYANVVGLFAGTGIGGGVVIDNKLFTGSRFAGAELGHMILNTEGPQCNCGQRGCLEAYTGKHAITREIRSIVNRGGKSDMLESMDPEDATVKSGALAKALKGGDAVALQVFDRIGYYLAAGIGNLVNIFNPEVFVLGGGVMEATEEFLMPIVRKYLPLFAWPAMLSEVNLCPSTLGDDAILYGAKALVLEGRPGKR